MGNLSQKPESKGHGGLPGVQLGAISNLCAPDGHELCMRSWGSVGRGEGRGGIPTSSTRGAASTGPGSATFGLQTAVSSGHQRVSQGQAGRP